MPPWTTACVVNIHNILAGIRAVREEGQMPLGTLVRVVALVAALEARNLLDRFGRQSRRWSHARHHEPTGAHAKVLARPNARVHLLLHVLLPNVCLSHLQRSEVERLETKLRVT